MLRIDHGRSVTSCGSKNENAGFDGCKSFRRRILHEKGGGEEMLLSFEHLTELGGSPPPVIRKNVQKNQATP